MCDKYFPSVLWCKIIKQAQDTLNMLRTSRIHPQFSAYHVLEGPHDFNRIPFAPPGTHATIINPPETRTSWGPRAMDAWYLSTAYDHYRAWLFHISSTGGNRVSGQAVFYPTHCITPKTTPMDDEARIAATLVQAICRLRHKNTQFPGRHDTAIQQLADIFQHTMTKTQTQKPKQQSSTNLTATATIRAAPRTHAKVTRANTPGILPISQRLTTPTSEGDRCAFSEGVNQQSYPIEATPDPDEYQIKKRRCSPRLIQNDASQETETPKQSNRPIAIQIPRFITQEALNLFTYNFHTNEQVRKCQ